VSQLAWDTSGLRGLSVSYGGIRETGVVTFNSSNEKPLPARTRRLYLMVGQRTIGRSLSTGRGATWAALAIRACLRRSLRPGCIARIQSISRFLWFCRSHFHVAPLLSFFEMGITTDLFEVDADSTLPVLAKIWHTRVRSTDILGQMHLLTILLQLLVVFERHLGELTTGGSISRDGFA